ncbi:MAG: 2-dehydro-3-deoxygalactonokinase [Alphaproteobacteria bacterium]|nr:2-dehydro-3-deoxygalactonokinase [Alphaproteobacteria bacterium]MDG1888506.1 2-dehydro-3-deoxygalactonokinase [Alphaproteobacteria bacterium]
MNDDTIGIGCDWGTSNLRFYRLGNSGQIIERRQFSAGVSSIKDNKFEAFFTKAIQDWLDNYPNIPVIVSGMAGSRQGWKETSYLPCPANIEKIVNKLTPIKLNYGRTIWIAPGLSYTNYQGLHDVMRGEEVQILGALSIIDRKKKLICLPGSHSKWATVAAGHVLEFHTFITGELFEAIKAGTIIGSMIDPNAWNDDAFIQGIDSVGTSKNILNQLFTVRTKGLFNQLTSTTAGAFLSGLLIGYELAGALAGTRFKKIYLIGDGQLTTLYQKALLHKGLEPKVFAPDIIASGHFKIIKIINQGI